MRILVTGANGFIGSALCRALLADGHEVVGVDNFASGPLRAGMDVTHLDVSSFADWTRLDGQKFDAIYHCAASFANELSLAVPLIDFESNAYGTLMTLEFARRAGCETFVYLGSSSSYGPGTAENLPFREDAPLDPRTPYAISKHVGEMYCRHYGSRFETYIFRLFNVYGPGDFPGPYRNAIPNMVKEAVDRRRIRVFKADSTRDFTYVDDAISIFVQALGAGRPGTYNVCTGEEVSILRLARLIAGELDGEVDIQVSDDRPWDSVVRRWGDNARLLEAFGARPFVSIEDGIGRTVEWLLRHELRVGAPAHAR